MFAHFFLALRDAKLPVSIKEYLTLIEAVDAGLPDLSTERFYYLARTIMIKDERHLDRFDQVFGKVFKGLESPEQADEVAATIPEEWLKKLTERHLTEEEKSQIVALGGWEKLMDTLRQRLKEQHERHQGGNKWIGTAGTSPFGAYGYNPEGVRVGQQDSRHRKAVKVWDRRDFRNLDGDVEIGTRNIKVALRRLRRFARQGAPEVLDLSGTIRSTARNAGLLDLKMVPERRNAVKVLLLLDAGGSMDDWVKVCEELFSAARSEFKHLEYFYFHNCVYDRVWRDNRRRHDETTPLWEVMHTYGSDYRLIFVGDASMSPYEISYVGGSVEHWNEEPGQVWMTRMLDSFPHAVWLNPVRREHWRYTPSIQVLRELMADRMFPLTLDGLDKAMRELSH